MNTQTLMFLFLKREERNEVFSPFYLLGKRNNYLFAKNHYLLKIIIYQNKPKKICP